MTTTTKTTTKRKAAAEVDPYAARDEKVSELRAAVRRYARGIASAEDSASRVIASLRRLDESVTAADLAASKCAVERATILHDSAVVALGKAEAAGPHRPIVADELRERIEKALRVPVSVHPTMPKDSGQGRYAVLVQTSPTMHEPSGALEGKLSLTVFRGEDQKSADWEPLKRELDPDGSGRRVMVATRGSVERQGRGRDSAEIAVRYLMPTISLLTLNTPSIDQSSAKDAPNRLAQIAVKTLGRVSLPVKVGDGLGGSIHERQDFPLAEAKVTLKDFKREVDEDRYVTTIRATVALTSAAPGQGIPVERRQAVLIEGADQLKGQSIGWLGRVEDLSVRAGSGGSVEATFVLHAKVA